MRVRWSHLTPDLYIYYLIRIQRAKNSGMDFPSNCINENVDNF